MYLEIDEGFISHRKTLRFCGIMQDQNAFAYLLRLWSWATRGAPDGSLAGMDPTDIEIAVQYRLMDGKCFRAMVAAGFVDTDGSGNPTEIHNWGDRTGGSIIRMEAAAKASRTRKERWKERQRNADGTRSGTPEEREGDAEGTEENASGTHQDKTSPVQTSPVKARQDKEEIPPAPARDPLEHGDVDGERPLPTDGSLTGLDLQRAFGRIRREYVKNALPWDSAPDREGRIGSFAARLATKPEAIGDVLPTMRLIFEAAQSGEVDRGQEILQNPAFGFGCWCSQFTALRERHRGISKPSTRASPPRDVRVGTGRSEDVRHTVTGEQAI